MGRLRKNSSLVILSSEGLMVSRRDVLLPRGLFSFLQGQDDPAATAMIKFYFN